MSWLELEDHIVDDHGPWPDQELGLDQLDTEQLRQLHAHLHRENKGARIHEHETEPEE